jgi:hypothetical protein
MSPPIFEEFYNCSINTCKISKELEAERDEKLTAKSARIIEITKLYSDNIIKMHQEIQKETKNFLKDMKNWKHYDEINIYNDCIKKNCKAYLIHFFKNFVPVVEQYITILKNGLKDKELNDYKKKMLQESLKKLNKVLKRIKNIDNWTNKEFDKQLYSFFTVKDIKLLLVL